MQNRKPDRSQLVVAGRSRIDNAAAKIQMRLSVAVVKNIAAAITPERGK